MIDTVEQRQDRERGAIGVLHLDDLSVSAAVPALAARALEQFLAGKDEGRDGFGDLDRRVPDPRREGRRRQAVLSGPGAGAAGMEDGDGERRGVTVVVASGDPVSANEGGVPQTRTSLCRHLPGQGLTETAQNHIGQHLADDVAHGNGRRPRCIEDGVFRCGDPDRFQGARVVGNVAADNGSHAEGGIGLGIGDRHVDSVGGHG